MNTHQNIKYSRSFIATDKENNAEISNSSDLLSNQINKPMLNNSQSQ